MSYDIAAAFEITDTMALFNAGICYEKADSVDLAIERYKSCAQLGYQLPNTLVWVNNLYLDNGRVEEALEALASARADYPREQVFIEQELNIYIKNNEYEKALENLKLAAELTPTNELLWYNLGAVSDNLSLDAQEAGDVERYNILHEDAINAYLKAIELAGLL